MNTQPKPNPNPNPQANRLQNPKTETAMNTFTRTFALLAGFALLALAFVIALLADSGALPAVSGFAAPFSAVAGTLLVMNNLRSSSLDRLERFLLTFGSVVLFLVDLALAACDSALSAVSRIKPLRRIRERKLTRARDSALSEFQSAFEAYDPPALERAKERIWETQERLLAFYKENPPARRKLVNNLEQAQEAWKDYYKVNNAVPCRLLELERFYTEAFDRLLEFDRKNPPSPFVCLLKRASKRAWQWIQFFARLHKVEYGNAYLARRQEPNSFRTLAIVSVWNIKRTCLKVRNRIEAYRYARKRKKDTIKIRILCAALLAFALVAFHFASSAASGIESSAAILASSALVGASGLTRARTLRTRANAYATGISIILGTEGGLKQLTGRTRLSEYIALAVESVPYVTYEYGTGSYRMRSSSEEWIKEPVAIIRSALPQANWDEYLAARNALESLAALYCTDYAQESYAIIEQGRPGLHFVNEQGKIRKIEQWKKLLVFNFFNADTTSEFDFMREWPEHTRLDCGDMLAFAEPVPADKIEYVF